MKYIFIIVFSMAALFRTYAQERIISLDDAIATAMERNPSVIATTLEVARRKALRKTAFELPKTDISLIYGQYNSIQRGDNNVTIMQGIPFPTVFVRQNELNKSLISSAVLKEAMSKNDLSFQVKQVFNQLLYLKLHQQSLLQQDSLLSDLLRITDLRYKTGESTLLAKTSAETQLSEIKNQAQRNETDIQIALNHLRLLCQAPDLSDVQGNLESLFTSSEVDTTPPLQNPSLAYARQQVDVTTHERNVEAARVMPDLRIGYFNQTLIGPQNINGQDQYIGPGKRFQGFQVGLSIPLWFVPLTSKVKAASIATDIAKRQYESVDINLAQQYSQAIQELAKNKNSLDYYRESALKTAELLIDQSRKSFKSGEVDQTILLLNLRQALTIREGYLLVLQQYNQSIIIIEYLNGKN